MQIVQKDAELAEKNAALAVSGTQVAQVQMELAELKGSMKLVMLEVIEEQRAKADQKPTSSRPASSWQRVREREKGDGETMSSESLLCGGSVAFG